MNGIKLAVKSYGGFCDYGNYHQVSSDGSHLHYFGLKFRKCPSVKIPNTINILAAGIAYTFYSCLRKESKEFDQIRVAIVDSSEATNEYTYGSTVLDAVRQALPKTKKAIDLLKKGDYDGALNLCDTAFIGDRKTIVAGLKKSDEKYGLLTGFQFFGFEFYTAEGGKIYLSICGIAQSAKKDHRLKIVLCPEDSNSSIVLFNYDF
jgi:hypothetical protein